jgi:NADH-quinone oxidoreductase subunit C
MAALDADTWAALRGAFPSALPIDADPSGPVVPVDLHVAVARFLKESLGFTMYVTVVASHWPQADGWDRFEVATVLRRPSNPSVTAAWRLQTGPEAEVPTLFPLFAGADWQEREQFDLVGVRFTGHPDLRRLMMPEDWEGHPLRKSYAIDTPHPPWR